VTECLPGCAYIAQRRFIPIIISAVSIIGAAVVLWNDFCSTEVVILKSGKVLQGMVVVTSQESIEVKTGTGRLSLAVSAVKTIDGENAVTYVRRAKRNDDVVLFSLYGLLFLSILCLKSGGKIVTSRTQIVLPTQHEELYYKKRHE
jgi:hypothetical protein